MAEISEATILRQAKELAQQDGNEWEYEFRQPLALGSKIPLKPILDEAGRQTYLARAREQLTQEKGDA
jgi:hypothetical protein